MLFNGRTLRYMRDVMGNTVAITDGDLKTELHRNLVNQVTEVVAPDGVSQTFEYDARGFLIAARQPGAAFEWARDANGEVIRETHRIGDRTYVIENERDPMGLRTGLRTSLGLHVDVRRDGLGDVVRLDDNGRTAVSYTRNEIGAPIRREFAGGGAQIDDYDAVGRLIRRSVVQPGAATTGAPEWVGRRAAGAIEKTYAYTPVDEVASIITADDGTTEFQYDLRRGLQRKTTNDGSIEQHRLDATGNYLTPDNEYLSGDRIVRHGDTKYTYDNRGFLEEKRTLRDDGAEQITRFVWNGFNLLQSVGLPDGRRVDFEYDAFARRMAKRVVRLDPVGREDVLSTTHYVWDLVNLIHEVNLQTNTTRTFLYEDNEYAGPIAERVKQGWIHYIGDKKEGPEELVDESGARIAKLERETFGRTRYADGPMATTPFRDPGQYADPETGLYYNRARYYDPDIGRFISPDPVSYEGGYNLYRYGPNPIGWLDPMGWVHKMSGAWGDGDMGGSFTKQYQSGMDPKYPPELNTRATCHTERKFLQDLKDKKKKGGKAKCKGQYPPCPNCHRAMQKHADESGTGITYEWKTKDGKKQSITYKAGKPPTGKGDSATTLTGTKDKKGAYAMSATHDDPNIKYKFDDWDKASKGYKKGKQAVGPLPTS